MSYDPSGWGGSHGGGYSSSGWGGSGGTPRAQTGTSKKPRKSDPTHDLSSSLVRLARTLPKLSGGDSERAVNAIVKQSRGLPEPEYQRVALSVPDSLRPILNAKRAQSSKGHDAVDTALDAGGSLLGGVFSTVAAPGRATLSGIAEYSREYEKAGRPFIPTNIDPGKVVKAAAEGFENKRHDSPMTIAKEAGDIRAKQGASTQAFGGLIPWKNDLRTNPIGGGAAGNILYDVGASIGTDPLTYLSFGLSGLAKAGLRGAVDTLGAERAGVLAEKGIGALDAEEKARLAKDLAPKVYEALAKSGRGGLKAALPKVPTPKNIASGHFLSAPRTIIPSPLRGLRAAKIIEGTGGRTAEVRTAASVAERTAAEAADQAKQLHASADLAETAGANEAHVAALRTQAEQADTLAETAAAHALEIRGTASREAATVAEKLRDTPLGRGLKAVGDSALARTTRGIFVPREAVRAKFGEGVAQALDDARVRYRGTYQSGVEDDINTLLHGAKESGVTNAELEHIIGPALDIGGGGKVAAIPDNLRPVYDALVEVRDRFTRMQVEAGVAHENALHVTDEYFPRVLTEEARALQGKAAGGLSPAVPGAANIERNPSGSLKMRTADIESPVSDINAEYQAENGVNKFEANPLTAFSKRSVSAHQDIATKQFADDVMKITDASGNPVMRLAKSLEKPPEGTTELSIPGVGRVFAPSEIANEVTKARDLIVNDEALGKFLGGVDKWMTLWKGYATVPLPFGLGFHERNAIGNVFLNWEAGISPADGAYVKAQRIQRAMSKGAKEGDVYKFLAPADKTLVESARKRDIVGEGFFGVDLPKNVNEPVHVPFRQASGSEKAVRARAAANPLNSNNALIAQGRKLGRAIEENARLAHYIAKLKETGSSAEAARSVRQYLFDYSDLTATEQQVFKRFRAFYTFSRKNLPVQVGTLLREPGKFSHIQALRTGVAESAPKPKGLYPSYLPELGGVPLPLGVSAALSQVPGLAFKKDQQIVAAPDLPLTSATNDLSPAVQLLTSLPGVKDIPGLPKNEQGTAGAVTDLVNSNISGGAPGALMTAIQAFGANKDFFSGRPLEGRVAAPTYALPFAQDRVLNGEKQPTISTKSQYIAESLLPILGKISSIAPQGDYEQTKAPRRRLSTFTGLRVYPLDEGTSRGEALRRSGSIAALLADLRAKGIDISSSRTKKKSTSGWGG